MIRCLIPITQEKRNENSLKRSCIICDRIHLLYVVDTEILERMERESAYVLNSDMLDALRQTLVESQRREAESIVEDMKCKDKVKLHFEVGDHLDLVEKYSLRLNAGLIMTDSFERVMLGMKVPLWVDRGNRIENAIFIIDNATRVKRLEKSVKFADALCKRLECDISLKFSGDISQKQIFTEYKKTEKTSSDLIIYQNSKNKPEKNCSFLVTGCDALP